MKISYKLIQKYIDCSLSPEALADKLTMAGLEVCAIEKTGLDLSSCVVGQILEIQPHPDADRLTVCQVNIGTEVLPIVCGAQNMKLNDKVPVALVSCRLPGGFLIKKSKIRGVSSQGMMCSEKELNLSEEASGLMILPSEAPIGKEICSYLGLDDVVLELDLTPNRGDCLSVRGIVREIATLTNETTKKITIDMPPEGNTNIQDMMSIRVDAPDLCPRYSASIISDVTIGPSPLWLVQQLQSMGIRSINNVVDVTNFVMMEWGQPLHAFDYDLIQEKRIIVRRAKEKEKIITLDEVERQLIAENLVIVDTKQAIALAGVMGGANTEISNQTHTILLESAFFDPISIRRTSALFGLHSEASHRFERGIDPDSVILALNRATQLIVEVTGGKPAKGIIDIYPTPFQPQNITLRLPMVKKVLGIEIPEKKIYQILQNMDFSIQRIDEQKLAVLAPVFRWDIKREVDLIEEIARIYGYENIPVSLPTGTISAEKKTKLRNFETKIRDILVGLGFSEAINFSFISKKIMDDLPQVNAESEERIYLKNPLTEDQNVMRNSLIAGLCKNIAFNQNRQAQNIRLFELGRCFIPSSSGSLPKEKMMLGAVMQGSRDPASWQGKSESLTFFDVKGVVEAFMSALGICDYTICSDNYIWMGSCHCCSIRVGNQPIGFLGEIDKSILEYFDITKNIFGIEIEIEFLNMPKKRTLKPIPKYPSITRDLALIIPEEIPYQELYKSIRDMNIKILQKIYLFDVYRGDQVPSGEKSFGLSLIYQSLEKTLTDKQVNAMHKKIINHLKQKFHASLRE